MKKKTKMRTAGKRSKKQPANKDLPAKSHASVKGGGTVPRKFPFPPPPPPPWLE